MMMISDDDHNYAKKVKVNYNLYMQRGRKSESWKPPLTLNHTVDANGIQKKTNQWLPFRSSLPGKLSWLLRIIEALYTITRVGENDR